MSCLSSLSSCLDQSPFCTLWWLYRGGLPGRQLLLPLYHPVFFRGFQLSTGKEDRFLYVFERGGNQYSRQVTTTLFRAIAFGRFGPAFNIHFGLEAICFLITAVGKHRVATSATKCRYICHRRFGQTQSTRTSDDLALVTWEHHFSDFITVFFEY